MVGEGESDGYIGDTSVKTSCHSSKIQLTKFLPAGRKHFLQNLLQTKHINSFVINMLEGCYW